MLNYLNHKLLQNSLTRKHQYRLIRKIKKIAGFSDPYDDLFKFARKAIPSAILDIGSYTGKTIAKLTDELDTPIYGFEPTPDTYKLLEERFCHNNQVQLFNCALSNFEGKAKFFSNKYPETNSLLDNDIGNKYFEELTDHKELLYVKTKTLDNWISEVLPDKKRLIVKADIQGAEGLLLDGGAKTFSQRVIAFFSEAQIYSMYKGQISFFQLHERMTQEFGFFLHNLYPCMHNSEGRAVQLDALWIKESFIEKLSAALTR